MNKTRKDGKTIAFLLVITFVLNLGALHTTISANQTNLPKSSQIIINDDKSNWQYTEIELLSSESTINSFFPVIAVDSRQNVHVAWEDWTSYGGSGTTGAIFYKYWNTTSQDWTGTIWLSDQSALSSTEPDLAIDNKDNLHVVWQDTSPYNGADADEDIFYRCWNATTKIWQTTEVVSTISTAASEEPAVAIDNDGNVYVVWKDMTNYDFAGTDYDIFYRSKNANTGLWSTTVVASVFSTGPSDEPALAVDEFNNVHIVWGDPTDYLGSGTDYDIAYRVFNPSTVIWSAIEIISIVSSSSSITPDIAIDAWNNIHVSWRDSEDYFNSETDYDIFYRERIASLSSWGTIEVVSYESPINSYSSYGNTLLTDSLGNVHFLWYDAMPYGSASFDILHRTLYKDNKDWSKLHLISTDSTAEARYSSFCIDLADHLYFVWQDYSDILGAGTDEDTFFRKYVGPPERPFLQPVVPNPTEDSTVTLEWDDVPGTYSYVIYRSLTYISSIEGLTPHHATSESFFIDSLSANGIYYYVIVAENVYGFSSISNCVFTDYRLPTLFENLLTIGLTVSLSILVAYIVFKKRKQVK